MDRIDYKLPPHSKEYEESLIASLLMGDFDPLEIDLQPDDFYRTAFQKIYSAGIELRKKQEPIDILSILEYLQVNGELENVGGAYFLATIIDIIPIAINPQYYAEKIKEKSILRKLIQTTNDISNDCYNNIDPKDVIESAQKLIMGIQSVEKYKTVKIGDIAFDVIDDMEKRSKIGRGSGVQTGFVDLDRILCGMQAGDFIIIAARPAMGKTAFAINITRNAECAGFPVLFFSLEMSRNQLMKRVLSESCKINSSRFSLCDFQESEWQKITDSIQGFKEVKILINDNPDIRINEIRSLSRKLKKSHNIGMVVIDYLQLMSAEKKAERRDLEVAEISRSLKKMAKELEIPVIALSQLNRMLEQRPLTQRRPVLSDLRESGSIEQDSDIVMFIYRDEIYNDESEHKGIAEIIVGKHRNGSTGKAFLKWEPSVTSFFNLAKNY